MTASCSNKKGGISEDLKQQLAAIYSEVVVDGKLQVLLPAVQQQKGGNDCGVFSIAFLFHLVLGDRPEELTFQQTTMRTHLSSYLTNLPFTHAHKRSCIPSPISVVMYTHVFNVKRPDVLFRIEAFNHSCLMLSVYSLCVPTLSI